MTSVFNGMATVLGSVFGGLITVTPAGQSSRDIQGILRNQPLEVFDQDGVSVSTVKSWVKFHKGDIADLREGDLIVTAAGERYVYGSRLPSGSPADDAFVIISLTEI